MEKTSNGIRLPGAIIIAGALIAVAIIWTKKPTTPTLTTNPIPTPTVDQSATAMAAVTSADHILGNPDAPVKIVEFSDPSCPYCKIFNPVMENIMTVYGPSGKVAWIYRHFPLDKPGTRGDGGVLHPNAGREAQSFECAAQLGGNAGFWAYEKKFYETTPSVTGDTPNGLDQKKLPDIAKSVGIDPVAFNSCVASGQFADKVEKQYLDGINTGVNGTPSLVIITPSGTRVPLPGAQSYADMKQIIDAILAGNSASSN